MSVRAPGLSPVCCFLVWECEVDPPSLSLLQRSYPVELPVSWTGGSDWLEVWGLGLLCSEALCLLVSMKRSPSCGSKLLSISLLPVFGLPVFWGLGVGLALLVDEVIYWWVSILFLMLLTSSIWDLLGFCLEKCDSRPACWPLFCEYVDSALMFWDLSLVPPGLNPGGLVRRICVWGSEGQSLPSRNGGGPVRLLKSRIDLGPLTPFLGAHLGIRVVLSILCAILWWIQRTSGYSVTCEQYGHWCLTRPFCTESRAPALSLSASTVRFNRLASIFSELASPCPLLFSSPFTSLFLESGAVLLNAALSRWVDAGWGQWSCCSSAFLSLGKPLWLVEGVWLWVIMLVKASLLIAVRWLHICGTKAAESAVLKSQWSQVYGFLSVNTERKKYKKYYIHI